MSLIPLLMLFTAAAQQSTTAVKADDALYVAMAKLDRAIFDAFNECRPEDLASHFDTGVEFYHDQTGLKVGVASLIEQQKKNICGKVRRELVTGSLKVYPMKGYGALMTGYHRFYQPANTAEPTGVAQFIHLCQWKDGKWKVTRVISFDHMAPGR